MNALNAKYLQLDKYLLVTVTGEYDFISAVFLFGKVLKEVRKCNLNNILCDITQMTGFDFNPSETLIRYNIAKYIGDTLPRDLKLVFLESPKQLDLFGETIMTNRGAMVKITANKTVALHWLELCD